ncbi:MAG: DUF4147 domain-containing protein [Euryarchaeota archaeon]|nr:DUF4147 domain-containing protein [Euryarchaeota archaeon]
MDVLKTVPAAGAEEMKLLNALDLVLLALRGDHVIINSLSFDSMLYVKHNEFDIPKKLHVVGAGKAACPMAVGLIHLLGSRIAGGIINTNYCEYGPINGIRVNLTAHPVPDAHTVEASRRVVRYIESLDEHDFVVFLISGGASSLLEVPRIPLDRYVRILRALLLRGANIEEINRVRIFLSSVKGGKLLGRFRGRCVSLIISDVMGAPSLVGSGLTYSMHVERGEVLSIFKKYGVNEDIPSDDSAPRGTCENFVLADNAFARKLLASQLSATLVEEPMVGDVREVAERILSYSAPGIYVFGGEPTVNVGAAQGKGGRNQELALRVAMGIEGTDTVFVSLGTDGVDGPTDAAGAMVNGDTAKKLRDAGIDLEEVLKMHDSYTALGRVGARIHTGYTGTNVADLMILRKI